MVKQKPYNILMLAPTMFFADYGNPVRILEEAVVLEKLGHKVTILAYPNGRDIAGLDIRRCWGVPFNYRVEVGSSRHKIYLDAMLGLKALSYISANKPDIIHAHMHEGALLGWILSKLSGAPLIFDFQGSLTGEMLDHNFIKETNRFFKPLRQFEERIDHMAKAILTSSTNSARLLETQFNVPAGRIHPTLDCVNAEVFNRERFSEADKLALKQQWGIPTNKKLLVYSGLLTEYQGVGLLLQALALLKESRDDFHLLLMGWPAVVYYQNLAHQLNIADKVTLTGKMPYEQLAANLALGDIAIAPKISATEGNGKILNYMSMALPSVAFETPVSKEYLSSYGIYAKAQTAPALAQAIAQSLDMTPQDRQQQGQILRKRAITHYSWETIGKQIETVYSAVLSGHPAPALAVKQASTQA